MIFQGDNYTDKLFGIAFLPLFSVIFFWSAFSSETSTFGRIIAVIIGLFILIFSILYFVFGRYKVQCEESQIVQIHTLSSIPIKYYSYEDLELLKVVPLNGGPYGVYFFFNNQQNSKTKLFVDFDNLNKIIPIIIHCKKINANIKIEVKSYDGKMRKFIIRELKKESCNFLIY